MDRLNFLPNFKTWVKRYNNCNFSGKLSLIFPWFCSVLIVGFSFIMSQQTGEKSQEISLWYSTIVLKIWDIIGAPINILAQYNNYGSFDYFIRKSAHFFIFFCLAITLTIGFRSFFTKKKFAFIYSFIFIVILACFDEFHQYFIPGRSPSSADVILDITGASFGILLMFCVLIVRSFWRWIAQAWQ